jgi:hypothetical protein
VPKYDRNFCRIAAVEKRTRGGDNPVFFVPWNHSGCVWVMISMAGSVQIFSHIVVECRIVTVFFAELLP